MSDDRKHVQGQGPDSQETRALAALRRLPRAQAPVEARDRARAAFLEGARASAPPPPQSAHKSRRGFLWSTVGLAAALVAAFLFGSTPSDQWVVLDVVQPEGVTAPGGQALATGHRLEAGTLVTAPGSEVELQLGDRLRFRMLPGTRLELPAAPGRWFDRGRELTLSSGEIYGTTGGQKLGFPLVFATEELTASLTGTTFAVFRTPEASCVCLWEGGITVVPVSGEVAPIVLPELRRVWVYRDGRAPEILPLSDMETMKLQMTEEAGLAVPGR
jgi:ferric-dicitrate binding protein FerR (iron transport regulator)|nr:FecR family protein [Candidatus Krumholzibacteria bacterium]